MQVCKYASMQVCKYTRLKYEVYKIEVCKYENMQVCKYANMQECKNERVKVKLSFAHKEIILSLCKACIKSKKLLLKKFFNKLGLSCAKLSLA